MADAGGGLRGASLRTRVMATAALLVVLTSLVTAVLGTTLLRSYLLSRSDAQLRDFATVASRIVQRQQLQPSGQQPSADAAHAVPGRGGQRGRADQHGGRAAGRGRRTAAVRRAAQRHRNAVHRCRPRVPRETPGASWCSGCPAEVIWSSPTVSATSTARSPAWRLPTRWPRASPSCCWPASACRWCGPAWHRSGRSSRRPRRSRAVTSPGASTIRRGNTEVGRLAEALDVMLASIEAAYLARADGEARALRSQERMRRFIADASHELRTPLTSVRGLAEYGLQQGERGQPGGTAAADGPDRPRGRPDGPAGGRSPAAGQVRRRARPGPPARRPGQHRGRGRPAGPHRGRRAADHAARRPNR